MATGVDGGRVDADLRQRLVKLGRSQNENHAASWDDIARRYLAVLEC